MLLLADRVGGTFETEQGHYRHGEQPRRPPELMGTGVYLSASTETGSTIASRLLAEQA